MRLKKVKIKKNMISGHYVVLPLVSAFKRTLVSKKRSKPTVIYGTK